MTDFPEHPLLLDDRGGGMITTLSGWALGPGMFTAGVLTATWPAANRAIFVPFRVPVPVLVHKMICAAGSTSGAAVNFDLGIYDAGGNRIVSSGSQLRANGVVSAELVADIADTRLLPGLYYLAMAADGASFPTWAAAGTTTLNIGLMKVAGMRQAASAFPLPDPVTFATVTTSLVPYVGALLRPE